MREGMAGVLTRQFETAAKLLHYHLDTLTDAECLWRPAAHVHRDTDGAWRADWPEREDYALGPASIAWLTWHIGYWWTTVLGRSFGDGAMTRSDILWPGDADGVRGWLDQLEHRWRAHLDLLTDDAVASSETTQWPFTDRPFADVVAWGTLELTKNAAEIGYVRFLYASRSLIS